MTVKPTHCPDCGKWLFGTQRCNWCGWNKTFGSYRFTPEEVQQDRIDARREADAWRERFGDPA